jgi:CBS domain-containing protein
MQALNVLSPPDHSPPLDSVMSIFHRLNRVLPENQVVATIRPSQTVAEAFRIMKRGGFSQLPVVEGDEVLGLFSYRSFSEILLHIKKPRGNLIDLTVDEFVEKPQFARVTDEFDTIFEHLDQNNAVLVGDPDRLQGIVTVMDVLRYLYSVASPFVLIAEIELAIRALIPLAVDAQLLAHCAKVSLGSIYVETKMPITLNEMTFNDYVQIVCHGDNWKYFEPIFGGMRETVRAKLVEVRDFRNDIFHFKREPTWEDHERLTEHRDWVLRKARMAYSRRKAGQI